jgi:dethiobiotin synthetase
VSAPRARPAFLVGVVGSGTGVGKTWATAATLAQLRADGSSTAARKPVQSFEPGEGATDADVLGAATGEPPTVVCPSHRWYPLAMAPPIAAARLGCAPIRLADLVAELTWPPAVDVGFVETVGGARSPLCDDGDSRALVRAIDVDHVLLVADAALGAINAVRQSSETIAPASLTVMLNRFVAGDVVHEANRTWLVERDGFTVVTDIDACVAALRRAAATERGSGDGRMAG